MNIDEIRDYMNKVHLGDYALGGVEITEEDFETIKERIDFGETLEESVESYLFETREILDEGLDENEGRICPVCDEIMEQFDNDDADGNFTGWSWVCKCGYSE